MPIVDITLDVSQLSLCNIVFIVSKPTQRSGHQSQNGGNRLRIREHFINRAHGFACGNH